MKRSSLPAMTIRILLPVTLFSAALVTQAHANSFHKLTLDPRQHVGSAASPAATYTLTSGETGEAVHVTVAASGRIAIAP